MKFDWKIWLGIAVVLLVMAIAEWSPAMQKTNFIVEILGDDPEAHFLKEEDVLAVIGQNEQTADERSLAQSFSRKQNLKQLEKHLRNNPFVADCEVARDVKGNIRITIRENEPIARVLLGNQGKGFYLTKTGKTLPLSENFTSHTLLITGAGTKLLGSPDFWTQSEGIELLDFLNVVHQDSFWDAQCAQLDVDQKNEWIMYPQVGQHKFDLGTLAKMKEKLYLLRQAYYKEILPRKGWGAYRTISVRYDGQVVCR